MLKSWFSSCGTNGLWDLQEVGPSGREEVHCSCAIKGDAEHQIIPEMPSRNLYSSPCAK
jgi:hypothetical protein